MKALAIIAVLLALPGNRVGLERPATEADLLRAFGFARCLAKAYEKTPFGVDAERVADGYFQMGRLKRQQPYDQVTVAAESIDAARPTIQGHQNLAIMKCLEFYESPRLKKTAAQLASQ
jgi:hypothetical protein